MAGIGPVTDRHSMLLPLDTHWEPATCEEVDCLHYLNGWITILPLDAPEVQFIRTRLRARNTWTEDLQPNGLIEFRFPPGQPCFAASEHRLPARPPLLVRRVGEREPQMLRVEDWQDSLHETVDKAVQLVQKG